MDRRMFLGSVGAIALAPTAMLTPKWKTPPNDMVFVESIGRWVPDKWYFDSQIVACTLLYNITSREPKVKAEDIVVFYDVCGWRSMEHSWIAFTYHSQTQTVFPLKNIKTVKIPMMGVDECMPYPHKSEFDGLKNYGLTVTDIVRERIKGHLCS